MTTASPAARSSATRSSSPEENERLVTSTVEEPSTRHQPSPVPTGCQRYSQTMTRTIDRMSPLPFYYQLKQILLTDLRNRELSPGTRLPGDHELCETYDVSRTVV